MLISDQTTSVSCRVTGILSLALQILLKPLLDQIMKGIMFQRSDSSCCWPSIFPILYLATKALKTYRAGLTHVRFVIWWDIHNEHLKHQTYQNTVPVHATAQSIPVDEMCVVCLHFGVGGEQCGEMWGKEGDVKSPCCLGSFGTTCWYGSRLKLCQISYSCLLWRK